MGLTPFIEQQALWEQISNRYAVTEPASSVGLFFNPMGPNPNLTLAEHGQFQYDPWLTNIPTLRCPSDPGIGFPAQGRTNYGVSMGDSIEFQNNGGRVESGAVVNTRFAQMRASTRGVFIAREVTRFRDILDGLSNTIMGGELSTDLGDNDITTRIAERTGILNDPSLCGDQIDPTRPRFWDPGTDFATNDPENQRGFKWASGFCSNSGITTILPPNREICSDENTNFAMGIYGPSSRHQGGCHVLMSDGAVIFITDSIEAGDSTVGNVVWNGTDVRVSRKTKPLWLMGRSRDTGQQGNHR